MKSHYCQCKRCQKAIRAGHKRHKASEKWQKRVKLLLAQRDDMERTVRALESRLQILEQKAGQHS